MKNISTGFGLCAIAAAVALYPVLDRFAPISKEAHAGVPVSAITSAALAQTAPTIVWYGTTSIDSGGYGNYAAQCIYRAWSDGRIEMKRVNTGTYAGAQGCTDNNPVCYSNWKLINDPAQGLAAASDSDFNGQVDGADLGRLLGNWGDAPRDQIPSSDCPLNLINP